MDPFDAQMHIAENFCTKFKKLGTFKTVDVGELDAFAREHAPNIQWMNPNFEFTKVSQDPKTVYETKEFVYGIARIAYKGYKKMLKREGGLHDALDMIKETKELKKAKLENGK